MGRYLSIPIRMALFADVKEGAGHTMLNNAAAACPKGGRIFILVSLLFFLLQPSTPQRNLLPMNDE